jgi:hypothetical protein
VSAGRTQSDRWGSGQGLHAGSYADARKMADPELERQFLQELIQWRLDELADYAATFEDLLSSEQEKFAADIKDKISNMPQSEKDQFENYYSYDVARVFEAFPRLLRTGFLVSCYSFLEDELMSLCDYLKKRHRFSVARKDLRDKGVVSCQNYLKKVAQISFPDQSNSWKEILFFNDIRNVIVHSNGVVEKDSVKASIERSQYVTVDRLNFVQLSLTFSEYVVVIIREFFDELFKAFGEGSGNWSN